MLLKSEVSQANDVDLLAVIIGNRQTAQRLLRKSAGSLFALLHAQPQATLELFCAQAKGLYAGDPLVKLQAVRELAARALLEPLAQRDVLSNPRAVRDFLRHRLAGLPYEIFSVLFLDAQHRLIAYDELFRGTLTQTSVYPREVVKEALQHNAGAAIFAHNHPSGICEPSRADELLTRALKEALALVDVKVVDHFIVAGSVEPLSFAERGLL